ncbi:MAG: FAD-dependent oxidoreductase [Myxococcota bacterium]
MTLPGSLRHRLPPEDGTVDGLFLAGDWTRTSIDGGSVEAAVESGERAAAACVSGA